MLLSRFLVAAAFAAAVELELEEARAAAAAAGSPEVVAARGCDFLVGGPGLLVGGKARSHSEPTFYRPQQLRKP